LSFSFGFGLFVRFASIVTMPPTTASQKPSAAKANGSNAAAKAAAPASPAHADEHTGKPDQQKYNEEQDAINKEIQAIKTKLVSAAGLMYGRCVHFNMTHDRTTAFIEIAQLVEMAEFGYWAVTDLLPGLGPLAHFSLAGSCRQ
jgi:hypothetical protein